MRGVLTAIGVALLVAMAAEADTVSELRPAIRDAAFQHGVDPVLMEAIIRHESANATSHAAAADTTMPSPAIILRFFIFLHSTALHETVQGGVRAPPRFHLGQVQSAGPGDGLPNWSRLLPSARSMGGECALFHESHTPRPLGGRQHLQPACRSAGGELLTPGEGVRVPTKKSPGAFDPFLLRFPWTKQGRDAAPLLLLLSRPARFFSGKLATQRI